MDRRPTTEEIQVATLRIWDEFRPPLPLWAIVVVWLTLIVGPPLALLAGIYL